MNLKNKFAAVVLLLGFVGQASAALVYDQNLANGVFFGSGNTDGGFTVNTQNDIEIGLRGKLRFDATNTPQNIWNSNGDGTYSFDAIAPPTGFGFAPGSSSSAIWNFEWSIDVSGSQLTLDDYTYLFEIDFDPSAATNFMTFDPINTPNDNAVQNQTAQNSWNMEFFNGPGFEFLNTANGIFDFRLSAMSNGVVVASSNITILQGVVDVPAPASILILMLGTMGLVASRKLKK